ncbi:phage tail protein [Mergibacter septicus]|uniref:Phage tail protein n=1 Tax=Mergibacter septicus TaxID=221402 RepID=A0A8D4LNE0_9PAST|nr:phage tail protein [Mergibacter septicus]QDJ14842.1 phage tail protein [Mergibacter septicus]UTU47730.1 phage tail protein [Mergibacter septicus]
MFQNTALCTLGMFVFMRSTLPFQSLQRDSSWRHPTNSVVGKMPQSQFLGKESESITLSGRLMPEITGGRLSLAMLELMADKGGSYPLLMGNSELIGFFVIEKISETRTELFGDGSPRAIDFTVQLKRTDDPMLLELADKVTGGLNEVTGGLVDKVSGAVGEIGSSITGAIGSVANGIGETVGNVASSVGDAVSSVANNVGETINGLIK